MPLPCIASPRPASLLLLALLTAASLPAAAQSDQMQGATAAATQTAAAAQISAPETIPGLGTTAFVTSTRSPEAQAAFLRGLLLLHLFEYPTAADAFITAQKLDPTFALSYWGEAMTYNHPVWNQLDAAAGKAALDKFAPSPAARAARIADPRERAYVATVELLYDGTGTKPERDKRYTAAMQQLSAAYPADHNAQLFYALALLGQSESVRDVPAYLQAAAISRRIFELEPKNPGAAHYWIHGMDDPAHAAGALPAARALSLIAPDAGHAQHMCSHIFMALGMWDDVVASNIEAIRVTNLQDRAAGYPAYACGHYPNWLEYGYFQQGRHRAALETVAACRQTGTDTTAWISSHPGRTPFRAKSAAALHARLRESYALMHDMAVVESQSSIPDASPAPHSAAPPVAVSDAPSSLPSDPGPWSSFASGLAAAASGDLPAARAALASLHKAADDLRSGPDPDPEDLQTLTIALDELGGLVDVKAGHDEAGLATLRRASETYRSMAFDFGPPITIKPPEELLGEVLLSLHNPVAARRAFEQSLERAPGRTLSLLGLARAQQQSGDSAAARATYARLLSIWHAADPDTPGLSEARAVLPAVTRR